MRTNAVSYSYVSGFLQLKARINEHLQDAIRSSSHSFQHPPGYLRATWNPDKPEWLLHHMVSENPPGNHEKKKRPFWRVIGLISALPVVSVLIWCLWGGEGTDLMRLGELELCGTALCLPTASLQRWKCETLIDHFNWSLLCRTVRSCAQKKCSLVLLKKQHTLEL